MSYPALLHWRRDRRRTLTTVFVYDWLCDELDFLTPRDCKREWVAREMVLDGGNVSRALALLIQWGYLKDHRVSKQDPRSLTLVHRLAPEHIVPENERHSHRRRPGVRKAA